VAQFPGATQYPVRWWGYPTVGAARRIKPTILLVVHITGNSRLPSALGEAQYSNRDGSGASFTFVTDRDGSIVQCLEPLTQTPWTNGDVNNPNMGILTVAAACDGNPYNMNEFCLATCENVGYGSTYPITAAQINTLGSLVAWLSRISGLPINRSTVLGHRDINSVDRYNCPTAGDLDSFLARVIAQAQQINSPSNIVETRTTPVITTGWTWLTNKRSTLIDGLGFRADADPALPQISAFPKGTSILPIARVTGKDGKPWYVTALYANGYKVGAVPAAKCSALVDVVAPTDCSAAVATATAPLQAALAGANSRIAAMKKKSAAFAADIADD